MPSPAGIISWIIASCSSEDFSSWNELYYSTVSHFNGCDTCGIHVFSVYSNTCFAPESLPAWLLCMVTLVFVVGFVSCTFIFCIQGTFLTSAVIKMLLACVLWMLFSSSTDRSVLLKFLIFSGAVDVSLQALSGIVFVDEPLEDCMHVILLPSMVLDCIAFVS